MKNRKVNIIIGTFLLMLYSVSAFAQNFPDSFPGGTNVDDTTNAPISSLIALGLIAGAIYGIKKMK